MPRSSPNAPECCCRGAECGAGTVLQVYEHVFMFVPRSIKQSSKIGEFIEAGLHLMICRVTHAPNPVVRTTRTKISPAVVNINMQR